MARYGAMFGPDVTFLGVDPCDIDDRGSYADADVVIVGAPYDSGTTYRSGARMGPSAIRTADYLPVDGARPSLALGVDPLRDLRVYDAGDVMMTPDSGERSLAAIAEAVAAVAASGAIPIILGGDHSVTYANVTGLARQYGFGRVSMLHFDAHADTGDISLGTLYGHGQPMRRLVESGAVRGDRFLQVGLRGYWPGPEVFAWMREQGFRWYEMTEIVSRGLDACLDEAFEIATDDVDGVFISVDIDVVDPGMAPGTGCPEPGGFTSRQLLDAIRRAALELPVLGADVMEVAPAYDTSDITAVLAGRIVLEEMSGIAKRRVSARGEES